MLTALSLSLLGISYAITVSVGIYTTGFTNPITDPILALMEILTLISAPLLVILMVAVHLSAPSDCKVYSLVALAFMILVAGVTSTVHFVGLTALRQNGTEGIVWPSTIYAIELLAWDFFLGLSLLFAAPVFQGGGLKRRIRISLFVTAILCIMGMLGPLTGDMQLQFIAVFGYGILLPIVWLLIARDFQSTLDDPSQNDF